MKKSNFTNTVRSKLLSIIDSELKASHSPVLFGNKKGQDKEYIIMFDEAYHSPSMNNFGGIRTFKSNSNLNSQDFKDSSKIFLISADNKEKHQETGAVYSTSSTQMSEKALSYFLFNEKKDKIKNAYSMLKAICRRLRKFKIQNCIPNCKSKSDSTINHVGCPSPGEESCCGIKNSYLLLHDALTEEFMTNLAQSLKFEKRQKKSASSDYSEIKKALETMETRKSKL